MATSISFTKQSDGTYQGSFTSTGTKTIIHIVRYADEPLFINISADNGSHNAIYKPPKNYKNQLLEINIPEGALVTVVSHAAVTYAAYIASELQYYTKDEVDALIIGVHQFEPVVANTLPTASADTMYKFYFIPKASTTEQSNTKEEWMTVRENNTYRWEKIGETEIDLSDYVTSSDLITTLQNYVTTTAFVTALQNYVEKVEGKGLSTNDYTNEEKTKLAGIASGAEVNVQSDWNQSDNTADDYIKNKPTVEKYVFDIQGDGTISTSSNNFTYSKTPKEIVDLLLAGKPIVWRFVESDGTILDLKEIDRTHTGIDPNHRYTLHLESVKYDSNLRYLFVISAYYRYNNNNGEINLSLSRNLTIEHQSDWNVTEAGNVRYIKNKPTLPTATQLLPSVTSSDNGKILMVASGAWTAASIPVSDNILY